MRNTCRRKAFCTIGVKHDIDMIARSGKTYCKFYPYYQENLFYTEDVTAG